MKILTERGTYILSLINSKGDKYFVNEEDGSEMIQDNKGKPKLDGKKAKKDYQDQLKLRLS